METERIITPNIDRVLSQKPYQRGRQLTLMVLSATWLLDSGGHVSCEVDRCSEVLASGYGVADDEPLLFTLIQYP